MVVESDEIDIEDGANALCSPEEIEEYLRLDGAFRVVSASYALMCDSLSEQDSISERDKRMILNLSADLQHKARSLMRLSPNLRKQSELHLLELRKEVR